LPREPLKLAQAARERRLSLTSSGRRNFPPLLLSTAYSLRCQIFGRRHGSISADGPRPGEFNTRQEAVRQQQDENLRPIVAESIHRQLPIRACNKCRPAGRWQVLGASAPHQQCRKGAWHTVRQMDALGICLWEWHRLLTAGAWSSCLRGQGRISKFLSATRGLRPSRPIDPPVPS
jgi:hypothetical protein